MSEENKESIPPAVSTPTSKESTPSTPSKRNLFGRKNKEEGGEGTAPPDKPQRGKSFKRIRGLLSGDSRKERRARKAQELADKALGGTAGGANSKVGPEDDAETIYQVDVDERSVASRPMASADGVTAAPGLLDESKKDDNKKKSLLKIVLLLLDPETRRFELLQLEFDSLKALVSDVLAQIPLSVTEEALRKQTYTGICGRDGEEQPPSVLLATFCQGNDVLAAVPTGLQAKECARLARPILGDDKVIAMLASSGVDAKGWKDETKKKKKSSKDSSGAAPTATTSGDGGAKATKPPATTTRSEQVLAGVVSVAIIAILLQILHLYLSAPIKPGHVVSPGIWLSQCGLKALVPPACNNTHFHLDERGVVTIFAANYTLAARMVGAVCPVNVTGCVKGLQFRNDTQIVIGGWVVHTIDMLLDIPLSPWPFSEPPKLKKVFGKKKK